MPICAVRGFYRVGNLCFDGVGNDIERDGEKVKDAAQ